MRWSAGFGLLVLLPGHAWAQATGRIVGAVTADANQPVANAQVSIPGARAGALTGADGRYTITNVVPGTYQVRVQRIGFAPATQAVTVAAGGAATADFRLQALATQLQEVVAVGYGTQRRADVTGAIASVSREQVKSQPAVSVEQTLQGRAAGVQVTQNTGAPGAPSTVRIRGGNSVLGGNDPLYVVDGFPVTPGASGRTNLLASINPDDIESIETLKDASATAIYGARGANGVVIITTRLGAAGTNRTEFDSYAGVQQVRRRLDLLDGRQFAEVANARARNDGVAVPFPNPDALPADTDWQDQIFRGAATQNYTLSFSGGSQQTRYLVSGNWLGQDGVIRGSAYERGSVRLNLDQRLSDRFRISNRLLVSRARADRAQTELEGGVLGSAIGSPPVVPVRDSLGNYSSVEGFFFSPGILDNPLAGAVEPLDRLTTLRLLGNVTGEYTLAEGLTARVLLGADYLDNGVDQYSPRVLRAGRPAGSGSTARNESNTYLNENTLNLARALGNDRLDVTGGFTWQTNRFAGQSASASGFLTDALLDNNLGAGTVFGPPSTNGSRWTLLSGLGRVNYNLNDRYLFTASGRADGSSRFGAGNKWAFFPSGAFAWRASNEAFMRGARAVSDLKLRLSYGRTGNQEIGLYQSLQRITAEQFVLANAPTVGFAPANIANPKLRWETTEQFDGGVDLGLFDQRLRLTADVYRKNTSDLLAFVELPSSSGFTSSIQNVGGVRNTGVEFALGADLVRRGRLAWGVEANVSANRNRVTATPGGTDVFAPALDQLVGSVHVIRPGQPLGAFYGFRENGLTPAGQIQYADQNGDKAIDNADRVIIGQPYPDFNYGVTSNLRVGRWELSAFVQGVQGAQVMNFNRFLFANSFSRGLNQVTEVLDYWTPERPNARYPRPSASSNFRVSDRFVEDASFLRLKNVRVAFNVPAGALRLARAQSGQVYVSGQNLLTRTNYTWFDPEVSTFGGTGADALRLGTDRNAYPTARTYLFGVRFGL